MLLKYLKCQMSTRLLSLIFLIQFCLDPLILVECDDAKLSTTSPNNTIEQKWAICKNCSCVEEANEPGYYSVDCQHKNILRIPNAHDLPGLILFLDLNYNHITKVEKFEQNEHLTHLSLNANGIKEIDCFAFQDLAKLKFIDLSYNQLEKIEPTLFEGLGELQFLNLSNNQIQYLPPDLLKSNEYLIELNLQNNPINFIKPDFFAHTPELVELNLAQNKFYSLQTDLFYKLNKLQSLNLSKNLFQKVPIEAIRRLKKLQKLDLSENPIKELNEFSFDGLESLLELIVHSMPKLVRVQKKTFSSLRNLQILTMSNNKHLSFIHEYAFLGMYDRKSINIREVDLRNNKLRKLSEHALPFCNLSFLDLRENPWHCDCKLHWAKYCDKAIPKLFYTDTLCSTPEALNGMELETIPDKNFACHNDERKSHYLFLITMFFMTGVFISVVMLIFRNQITSVYGSHKRQEGSIYYVRAKSENEG